MGARGSTARSQTAFTACGGSSRRRTGCFCRAIKGSLRGGGAQYQAGDSHPRSRARRVLVGAFSGSARRRSPCNAAVEPSRGSAGATGKDGRDRRRDAATFAPHTLAFCVSGWRRCVRRRANARNYRDNSGDHKNRKYAAISSCFVAEEALTLQRPQPDDALMIVARGGKKDEGGLAA